MPFQILSLSGGGFLGLYTVSVLADLEEQIGAPLGSRFDLFAGTSVGGIIAIGLANEVPAAQIKEAFERRGTAIFSDRNPPANRIAEFVDVLRWLLRPKYSPAALRDTIVEIIGAETTIGDLKHPCMIPAVCLTKGGPQIFKTDHHVDFRRDCKLRAVDVALATSAAPGYFPIAEIGDALFADGGLYANSPDLLALHEAEHFFGVNLDDIRLLSVGTTTSRFSFSHGSGRNFGLWKWAYGQRLVRAMISSQQQIVDNVMRHRLKGRYVRLDFEQSPEQERSLSLDTANETAQRTMRAMAYATAQAASNDALLAEILAHNSAVPRFFHRRKAP
jgi:patatin-like phospholipase/acyl hydrolase